MKIILNRSDTMRDSAYRKAERKLYEYTYNKAIIKNRTVELEAIENEYTRDGYIKEGISYDRIITSPTNSKFSIETWLLYHNEEYDRLLGEKSRAVKEVKIIDNALEVLNNLEKEVIELRYFKDKTWIEISKKIERSTSNCKQIRVEAIEKIKKVI